MIYWQAVGNVDYMMKKCAINWGKWGKEKRSRKWTVGIENKIKIQASEQGSRNKWKESDKKKEMLMKAG